MPIYVYRCDAPACRHRFEATHSIAACDAPHACPACGGQDTHRVPQASRVNWGGLAPSQGTLSPAMRALADEGNRRRRIDAYGAAKAARGA